MTAHNTMIPVGSQTVGPYFRIGLAYLIDRTPPLETTTPGQIEMRGQVLDRDGTPVPDAMLEFWSPSAAVEEQGYFPAGFRRAATDVAGSFAVNAIMPTPVALADGRMQAPHMLVLVFARGLLRHLLTRIYFEGEAANAADPVLTQIAPERRATLLAQRKHPQSSSYRWNVVLQGRDETVFFAW